MPLAHYGVLKGRPIDRRLGAGTSPHYQIRIVTADGAHHRIAINVKSKVSPSELLYLLDDRFQHPICDRLIPLEEGFHALPSNPAQGGLDYIRGNLFRPEEMVPLPFNVPGPDNDLNEKFDAIVQRALADEAAMIYAFGEPWGPESSTADKYFGFIPGRGIHDIHMNQGNSGQFLQDNGVWQDGGLLVHFPHQSQWVAVFTAFQSQAWHTDDTTGHPLPPHPPQPGEDPGPTIPTPNVPPTDDLPDGLVRIVAALVNSVSSPEVESVTILNTSPADVDLQGWHLADKQKAKMPLAGVLPSGQARRVEVAAPMTLSNKGGIITLLDDRGRKVDGVAYTREQARQVGWTLTF